MFATGCLDKALRLWSRDQKAKPLDIQQTQDYITAVHYSPNGQVLVVGFATGQFALYASDTVGRLNYVTRVDCRNRRGKFSSGRKVTGIQFLSKNEFLIATNDSRLRTYSLQAVNSLRYKYKGHRNENLPLDPSAAESRDYIVSGSEDGNIYVWN